MNYNDKIISFFNTPFPVGMSLVIIQDHCLSSKIDTILGTIIEIHLYICSANLKSLTP